MPDKSHKVFATLLTLAALAALVCTLGSREWFVDKQNPEYGVATHDRFGLHSSIERHDDIVVERSHRERIRALEAEHAGDTKVFYAEWFWKLGLLTFACGALAIVGLVIGLVAVYWPNRFTALVASSRLSGVSARSVTRFVLAVAIVAAYVLSRVAPAKLTTVFWVFQAGALVGIFGNHLLAKHLAYEEVVAAGTPSVHKQIGTGLATIAIVALAFTLQSRNWFGEEEFEARERFGLWSNVATGAEADVVRSNYARAERLGSQLSDDSDTLSDARGFWKAGIVVLGAGSLGVLGLGLALLAVYRPNRITRRISARGFTALWLVVAMIGTFKLIANKPASAQNAVWIFFVFTIIALVANEMLSKHVPVERVEDPDEVDGELPVARVQR